MKLLSPQSFLCAASIATACVVVFAPGGTDAIFGINILDNNGNTAASTTAGQTAALGLAALAVGGAGVATGLLLSRNNGNRRRNFNRRPNRRRFFRGKRDATSINNDGYDVEASMRVLSLVMRAIAAADAPFGALGGSQCFRRTVCEQATEELQEPTPLFNLLALSEKVDEQLPEGMRSFYRDLSVGRELGEATSDVRLCRSSFACPFTGMVIGNAIRDYGEAASKDYF